MWSHSHEATIKLILGHCRGLPCPARDMITEDTFMKLVKNIRSNALANVTVRKISPERIEGAKIISLEFWGLLAILLLL